MESVAHPNPLFLIFLYHGEEPSRSLTELGSIPPALKRKTGGASGGWQSRSLQEVHWGAWDPSATSRALPVPGPHSPVTPTPGVPALARTSGPVSRCRWSPGVQAPYSYGSHWDPLPGRSALGRAPAAPQAPAPGAADPDVQSSAHPALRKGHEDPQRPQSVRCWSLGCQNAAPCCGQRQPRATPGGHGQKQSHPMGGGASAQQGVGWGCHPHS